jgi:ATP-dependent DNA helicase PIF1
MAERKNQFQGVSDVFGKDEPDDFSEHETLSPQRKRKHDGDGNGTGTVTGTDTDTDTERWMKKVGTETTAVYQALIDGRNVLLHGYGGSGKSYALKEVGKRLMEEGIAVACTASTGCAAVGYSDAGLLGSTIHHWSGIGLGREPVDVLMKHMQRNFNAVSRMKSARVLLVDEISMISAELWDKLDTLLRLVRKCHQKPFGGLVIAVSGDFMQLSPIDGTWIFGGKAWKACDFFPVEFSTPHRHMRDPHYLALLSRARFGRISVGDETFLASRIRSGEKETSKVKPTTLFPRRKEADGLNKYEMEKLPGEETVFDAKDSYVSRKNRGTASDIPESYVRMLDAAIPKTLRLKIGSQVMLKKNINVEAGLVNGTRGVVCEFTKTGVNITTVSGTVVELGQCEWDVGTNYEKATRSQIPLILAWGLTIHASQGATLDTVECDLGPNVFANGQAYVALSRVRTGSGLRLLRFSPSSVKSDPEATRFTLGLAARSESMDPSNQKRIPATPVTTTTTTTTTTTDNTNSSTSSSKPKYFF